MYFDDGYYDSPETLVEAFNLDKVSRVKCSRALEEANAGYVVAGQNIKKATKRRATAAGRAAMSSLLATPLPPDKRIKRTAPSTKRIKRTAARRRTSPTKRQRQQPDVFSYSYTDNRARG